MEALTREMAPRRGSVPFQRAEYLRYVVGFMRRSVSSLTERMGMTTLVEAASATGAPQGKACSVIGPSEHILQRWRRDTSRGNQALLDRVCACSMGDAVAAHHLEECEENYLHVERERSVTQIVEVQLHFFRYW
jgi:hypothetical protein